MIWGVGWSHHVSPEDGLALHVLEAELADVQAAEPGVLLGVGRVVPGVQLVAPEQDGLDHVAALRDLTLDAELLLLGAAQRRSTAVVTLVHLCERYTWGH